jgi:hypothetical protein
MSKQNKQVTIEVDAATMKQLGRASEALSELAGAWILKSDDRPAKRAK